jgi:hypothetical protein
MVRNLTILCAALFRPDRTFAGPEVRALPRVTLVVVLFLVYVTGARLVEGSYQTTYAKTLAVLDVDTRMGGLLQNAPSEVQAQLRGQMLDTILGRQSGVMTAVRLALSGVGFLLVVLELWLVSLVASQFFGGQEDRHARPRASALLFLVAFVPLALRRLAAGVVMALGSPDAAANALTLADYRRISAVRFDLLSLLPLPHVTGFLAALGRMMSDPFYLWTFALLALGGREVFRIPLRGALGLCVVLVAVLALQATLFTAVGMTWEI